MSSFDLSKRWCFYFNEISKIPRESRHEEAIAAYILRFADAHHLFAQQDRWGNTILRKPASKGHENSPRLMLQAHMDMVCVKTPDSTHDFATDPLDLYVENGELRARGTTLGADDGVGVAYMLAILEDDQLTHPPLECVFTVMEEIGLEGALHMVPEQILSRRIISLDGGSETSTMCCAAGGIKGFIDLPAAKTAPHYGYGLRIVMHGLAGGHSGIAIDQGHANAICLGERFLHMLEKNRIPFELCAFQGGAADNSIPQCCTLSLNTDSPETLCHQLQQFADMIRVEFHDCETGILMDAEPVERFETAYSSTCTHNLLRLIQLLPDGIFSFHIPLQVPSASNNIGLLLEKDDHLQLWFRIRGLLDSMMDELLLKTEAAADCTGGAVHVQIRYPGWNYNGASPLRDTYSRVIQRLYGHPAKVEGSHGGNETGVFAGLHPDADIISIGSIEQNFHTPQECLNLAAFDRMYRQLVVLLAELADEQK